MQIFVYAPEDFNNLCVLSHTLPQRGATQSLNLSVASGIILSEWIRQMEGQH